ncbi:hypothetical protein HPB49_026580 [Dermacentor silvarum]|nr:hypothetical protein HPB49_026580 [Dermacentor silvarum]
MVEFPVYGLDMSPYYCGPRSTEGPSTIYDLFAVTNHHGGMLGGHYTAFARCVDPVDTHLSEIGGRLSPISLLKASTCEQVFLTKSFVTVLFNGSHLHCTYEIVPLRHLVRGSANEPEVACDHGVTSMGHSD